MQVEIYYCRIWNYKPKAARVAAELEKEFGAKSKLVAGANGIFDVIVDGKKVFSKFKAGRFPETGEITGLIKK